MLTSIIAGVVEGLFGPILRAVVGWLDKRQAQKQGAEAEAAKVTSASEKTQEAISQAEASGPSNINDAIQRARNGSL